MTPDPDGVDYSEESEAIRGALSHAEKLRKRISPSGVRARWKRFVAQIRVQGTIHCVFAVLFTLWGGASLCFASFPAGNYFQLLLQLAIAVYVLDFGIAERAHVERVRKCMTPLVALHFVINKLTFSIAAMTEGDEPYLEPDRFDYWRLLKVSREEGFWTAEKVLQMAAVGIRAEAGLGRILARYATVMDWRMLVELVHAENTYGSFRQLVESNDPPECWWVTLIGTRQTLIAVYDRGMSEYSDAIIFKPPAPPGGGEPVHGTIIA